MSPREAPTDGLLAVIERGREASRRRGAALLGLGVAAVPAAIVDDAFSLSDRLLAGFAGGDTTLVSVEVMTDAATGPTLAADAASPALLASLAVLAILAILWFAAIGLAIAWRARVDPDAAPWLGPICLSLLLLAAWRLGSTPMVFVGLGLAIFGVIYLRDAPPLAPLASATRAKFAHPERDGEF